MVLGKKNTVAKLLIFLKRYIVGINFFFRIIDCVFFRRGLCGSTLLCRLPSSTAPARSGTELDVFRDYLGAIFLLATCFVIPASRLYPSFDEDRASFFQILSDQLRLATERDDIVIVGAFLLLPVFFPDAIGRDGKISNLYAGRQCAQFRIAGEVAVDECFVDVHILTLPQVPRWSCRAPRQTREDR